METEPIFTGDVGIIGTLVVTILGMLLRELRWHRMHKSWKREREELHRSLNPPKNDDDSMPPWNEDVTPTRRKGKKR